MTRIEPVAPAHSARPGEPSFWLLVPAFGAIFFIATTISFLAPLLVQLADDLDTTLATAGQLVVVTAIAWAVGSPFMGLISDRLGRRPVLVICLVGMGTATPFGAFVPGFALLVVLRVITGLFGSGAPAGILGTITDVYPPHRRGRAIGYAQSGFNVATLLGVPVVGAVGGQWGWRVSFIVVGCALLLAAVFVRLTLPAGHRGEPPEEIPGMRTGTSSACRASGRCWYPMSLSALPSWP